MLQYDKYDSPLGILWLTGKENVLTGLSFLPNVPENAVQARSGEFDSVKKWLDGYFRKEPPEPEFSMVPEGTPFQCLIWNQLLKIPYGKTKTYGELAREAAQLMGKEKMSAQAVGQAVGRNPIAVIVPCHRIVGSDGKLTGYAYGIHRKAWLLQHEQK